MKEQPKIGVITTCQKDFDRYFDLQPKSIQPLLQKISVMKDIRHKEYAKAVLLIESKNATDYLIKKVTESSLVVEDLSKNIFYN